MITEILIPVSKPYSFPATLQSHGWVGLLPNIPDDKVESFSRTEALSSGIVVDLQFAEAGTKKPGILIVISHTAQMSDTNRSEIEQRAKYMLRLDEDLSEFYAICRQKGGIWEDLPGGKGYLLRSPTIFEDLVKVICTTNIQWGGTKRMVRELVDAFGSPNPINPDLRSFPSPEAIAAVTMEGLKERVRLGYRTDYVYELSKRIADGDLNTAEFLDTAVDTDEVKKRLLAIKGVGNYAAASMLMLLGRYDQIPVDTVFRDYMKAKHFENKEFLESDALQIYSDWGKWKYLAYWYEMLLHYYPEGETE